MDFDATFDRYHASLFRYVHRLTGDADAAADIAQDAFVRLWEHDVAAERARAWLFTVATNLVRDRARSRNRHRRLLEGHELQRTAPDRPDDAVERAERIEAVRAVLDRLDPRDRQLLLLRQEGFRYREIAGMLDVAPSSVGQLLARALRRFEALYTEQDPGPQGGRR